MHLWTTSNASVATQHLAHWISKGLSLLFHSCSMCSTKCQSGSFCWHRPLQYSQSASSCFAATHKHFMQYTGSGNNCIQDSCASLSNLLRLFSSPHMEQKMTLSNFVHCNWCRHWKHTKSCPLAKTSFWRMSTFLLIWKCDKGLQISPWLDLSVQERHGLGAVNVYSGIGWHS